MIDLFRFVCFVYSICVACGLGYLARSIRHIPPDFLYCHLVCIMVCILLKLLIDAIEFFSFFARGHTKSSDIALLGIPFSCALTSFYIAIGTVHFLIGALCQYLRGNNEESHCRRNRRRIPIIMSFALAFSISMAKVLTGGSMLRACSGILFGCFSCDIVVVVVVLVIVIVRPSKYPEGRRQFLCCFIFALVTLCIHLPDYASTYTVLFFSTSLFDQNNNLFGSYLTSTLVNQLFPGFIIPLAFLIFNPLRYALLTILGRGSDGCPSTTTVIFHQAPPSQPPTTAQVVAAAGPFAIAPPPYSAIGSTSNDPSRVLRVCQPALEEQLGIAPPTPPPSYDAPAQRRVMPEPVSSPIPFYGLGPSTSSGMGAMPPMPNQILDGDEDMMKMKIPL